MTNKNAYAQSGVDVEAGYEVVERIKKHVARTERAGVMGALGGFGGMFAVEEAYVSTAMGTDKVKRHMDTGAEFITGSDSSCLMHMQGIAAKKHYPVKFMHVAEILAAGL